MILQSARINKLCRSLSLGRIQLELDFANRKWDALFDAARDELAFGVVGMPDCQNDVVAAGAFVELESISGFDNEIVGNEFGSAFGGTADDDSCNLNYGCSDGWSYEPSGD